MTIAQTIGCLDWDRICADLDADGYAIAGTLPAPDLCTSIAATYEQDRLFRNRVVMARHGFGQGKYGAFVLTEQRPRRQSRATVVSLLQGEAVIFAAKPASDAG